MNFSDQPEETQLYLPLTNKASDLNTNLVEENIFDRDMAVITCYFNWAGFINPVRNLNRFLRLMKLNNIPVYGVELSLTDKFITIDEPNWKHIKVSRKNVCFQKEACLNLAEKIVPIKFSKIAWIDADLHFTNKNWYEETSKKLETYKLVQMYEFGEHMDRFGKIAFTLPGVVSVGGPPFEGYWNGHPGGALAARRDFWKNGGLYPYSFMGASDTILMTTIYGTQLWRSSDWKELNSSRYLNWKEKIKNYLSASDVSYISGNFIHEWHGDRSDRNYSERNKILSKLNFEENIKLNEDGILEFVGTDSGLHTLIQSYFDNRKEDGNVLAYNIKPTINKKDMAIVSCFFNWTNYKTPQRNLCRFKRHMDSRKIPYYGIELSLDGNFISNDWENWKKIKVSHKNVCFQKEAAINALVRQLPPEFLKIAWIDPDLEFLNENWYQETSVKLNEFRVLQLFSNYVTVDKDGKTSYQLPGMVFAGGPTAKIEYKTHCGAPGGALAASREMWNRGCGGLYPYSIMGGGDTVFMYTIYEALSSPDILKLGGLFNYETSKNFNDWRRKITSYIGGKISYVSGTIYHEWHGDHSDRGYADRYDIIKDLDFENCIKLDENRLLEIINVDDSVYTNILEYFKKRKED